MPKRIRSFFLIIIALLSLLAVFSCGSGDKIGAGGTNPVDLVSGNNTGGTGGGGGGGGGGGTTACVVSTGVCYEGLTQTLCNYYAVPGFTTVTFTSGSSCAAVGYSNCISVGGGISQCT